MKRGVGDWFDEEPGLLASMIHELQRLKRRMKAHPVPVLTLATLMTAFVLWRMSVKPKIYTAEIALRVSQGTLSDENGSPLPNRALQDYIYSYVLNKKVLEQKIILERGYFKDVYDDRGLDAALEEFREPLSVRAFRNYFIYDRRYDSTPRSVHVAISYSRKDPDKAYDIVRTLADIVVNNESARRLREARFAAENARAALDKAKELLDEHSERLNALQYEFIRAQLIGDDELMATTTGAIDELEALVKDEELSYNSLRIQQERIAFRLRLEESSLAVLWEIAWEDRPRVLPPPGPVRLTILGVLCFCVFVPLCAITLGTFNSRIHELEDVTRLGIPVVGHIPAFRGDHVGSLLHRGALAGRGWLVRIGLIKSRRMRDNRIA